jgi:hypothetical protein
MFLHSHVLGPANDQISSDLIPNWRTSPSTATILRDDLRRIGRRIDAASDSMSG